MEVGSRRLIFAACNGIDINYDKAHPGLILGSPWAHPVKNVTNLTLHRGVATTGSAHNGNNLSLFVSTNQMEHVTESISSPLENH